MPVTEEKKSIYLSSLSISCSKDHLHKLFSEFGEILDVYIKLKSASEKKMSDASLTYGFVHFKSAESAAKAMKNMKDTVMLHGMSLRISWASKKCLHSPEGSKDSDKNPEITEEESFPHLHVTFKFNQVLIFYSCHQIHPHSNLLSDFSGTFESDRTVLACSISTIWTGI